MELSENDQVQRSNVQTPLSMITARNKLKEVEDKIYEARQRLDIMYKKNSKQQCKNMNKTRMEGFRSYIRQFASRQRSLKKQHQMRKSQQINSWHEINMDRRAQHKDKINEMKEMIQTQNRWVYENIRRQKQKNQQLIKKQKSKQHENKRKKRDQLLEDELKRTAYLKQYLKNKHLTAKLAKQQETQYIHDQILMRQKYLQKIERKTSQMSMNPENSLRSKSNEGYDSRVSNNSRGFKISNKKKQEKNLLQ